MRLFEQRPGITLAELAGEMGVTMQRAWQYVGRLEAASFEDLPGKWQAAILAAERNRPKLRVVR
jgi:hypothetical protein